MALPSAAELQAERSARLQAETCLRLQTMAMLSERGNVQLLEAELTDLRRRLAQVGPLGETAHAQSEESVEMEQEILALRAELCSRPSPERWSRMAQEVETLRGEKSQLTEDVQRLYAALCEKYEFASLAMENDQGRDCRAALQQCQHELQVCRTERGEAAVENAALAKKVEQLMSQLASEGQERLAALAAARNSEAQLRKDLWVAQGELSRLHAEGPWRSRASTDDVVEEPSPVPPLPLRSLYPSLLLAKDVAQCSRRSSPDLAGGSGGFRERLGSSETTTWSLGCARPQGQPLESPAARSVLASSRSIGVRTPLSARVLGYVPVPMH